MRLGKFLILAGMFFLLGILTVYLGFNRAPLRQMPPENQNMNMHGQGMQATFLATGCPDSAGSRVALRGGKSVEI